MSTDTLRPDWRGANIASTYFKKKVSRSVLKTTDISSNKSSGNFG